VGRTWERVSGRAFRKIDCSQRPKTLPRLSHLQRGFIECNLAGRLSRRAEFDYRRCFVACNRFFEG